MKKKIVFPRLELKDIDCDFERIMIDKLSELYEPYFDYHFFEAEIKRRTGALVDFSNFDDIGIYYMAFFIDRYQSFDADFVRKTFLDIYNDFVKQYNNN